MSDKGSGFFSGLIVGGLLGLSAGLLLAPRPGRETREVVNMKLREALARLDRAVQEERDAIEIAIAEGKQAAQETSEKVSEVLSEAMAKVERPE